MFYSYGNHQTSDEEHDGGLHVEHAHLSGGHDAQEREENNRKESCGWNRYQLS